MGARFFTKYNMPGPRIEPRTTASQADVLTTTLPRLSSWDILLQTIVSFSSESIPPMLFVTCCIFRMCSSSPSDAFCSSKRLFKHCLYFLSKYDSFGLYYNRQVVSPLRGPFIPDFSARNLTSKTWVSLVSEVYTANTPRARQLASPRCSNGRSRNQSWRLDRD